MDALILVGFALGLAAEVVVLYLASEKVARAVPVAAIASRSRHERRAR